MKEYIKLIAEVAEQSEEFRPAVEEVVKVITSYGPEAYKLLEGIGNGAVDLKAAMIERFQRQHGFTKDEAILLTLDSWHALTKLNKNSNQGK